jgi:flagellar biosynthesis protein FlhG
MSLENSTYSSKLPFVISIVSGKGGVGKSVIAANISNILSQKGYKVLIWDGDYHFPNLHLLFGVEPPIRAKDIYNKSTKIQNAIFKVKDNLDLIADFPSENLNEEFEIEILIEIFKYLLLETDYDVIIIDTSAGLSEMMLNLANFSNLVALVINDEPTALLDGYALTKLLLNFIPADKIKVIVNNVIDSEDFQEISDKLKLVTEKFLKINFETIGFIPYSRIVRRSIFNHELFTNESEYELKENMEEIANYFGSFIEMNVVL